MNVASEFVTLDFDGRSQQVEYQWTGNADGPLMVFLHEGLGSLSMWKDFPQQLCVETGCRGLVYSRPGYGLSTPRAADERWGVEFMHRQAIELLPALLRALDVDAGAEPPWLFGHSDGGSIALIHAARFPERVAGLIVLAPHILVEDISVESIAAARRTYLETDLKARLGRYHDNPDSAFWGWNDIWLDPDFRSWSIENELAAITCPVLAVQGVDDEYGSLAQIRGIAERVKNTELVELPDCGHSPHRDQASAVIERVTEFVGRNRESEASGNVPLQPTG